MPEDIVDELRQNADAAERAGYIGDAELLRRAALEIVLIRRSRDHLLDVMRGAEPLIEGSEDGLQERS